MASESGGQSERDPFGAFVDDIFEEMVRDAGISHAGTASRQEKDPLAGALMEAAVAALSQPPSHSSELERVLFAQTLATALADSLAPALAEVLASEIMKVLTHHAASQGDRTRQTMSESGRRHRSPGDGDRS